MNDLLPFTHADEGIGSTHNACRAQSERYGESVECCSCSEHDCENDMGNFCRDSGCPYYILGAVHKKSTSGCKYE